MKLQTDNSRLLCPLKTARVTEALVLQESVLLQRSLIQTHLPGNADQADYHAHYCVARPFCCQTCPQTWRHGLQRTPEGELWQLLVSRSVTSPGLVSDSQTFLSRVPQMLELDSERTKVTVSFAECQMLKQFQAFVEL